MPIASGRLSAAPERFDAWAVGSWLDSGTVRPLIYHKPVGGNWRMMNDGDGLPAGRLAFKSGCRNSEDPRGTIYALLDNQTPDPLYLNDFLATYRYAAAKSTDAGATWETIPFVFSQPVHPGSAATFQPEVNAIFSPAVGSVAMSGSCAFGGENDDGWDWWAEKGFWISTGEALTFVSLDPQEPNDDFEVLQVAADDCLLLPKKHSPFDVDTVIAVPGRRPRPALSGTWRPICSVDGGFSWFDLPTPTAMGSNTSQNLAIAFDGENVLMAAPPGSSPGVYRSTDLTTWTATTPALSNVFMRSLAAKRKERWMVSAGGDIYTCHAASQNWRQRSGSITRPRFIGSARYGLGLLTGSRRTVFRSVDQGDTWQDEDLPDTPSGFTIIDIFGG